MQYCQLMHTLSRNPKTNFCKAFKHFDIQMLLNVIEYVRGPSQKQNLQLIQITTELKCCKEGTV